MTTASEGLANLPALGPGWPTDERVAQTLYYGVWGLLFKLDHDLVPWADQPPSVIEGDLALAREVQRLLAPRRDELSELRDLLRRLLEPSPAESDEWGVRCHWCGAEGTGEWGTIETHASDCAYAWARARLPEVAP